MFFVLRVSALKRAANAALRNPPSGNAAAVAFAEARKDFERIGLRLGIKAFDYDSPREAVEDMYNPIPNHICKKWHLATANLAPGIRRFPRDKGR